MVNHHDGTVKWRKLSFLCESIIQDSDLNSLQCYFESLEKLSTEEIDKMATGEHSYIVIRAALKRFVLLTKPVGSENKTVKAIARALKPLEEFNLYKALFRTKTNYQRNTCCTHKGLNQLVVVETFRPFPS